MGTIMNLSNVIIDPDVLVDFYYFLWPGRHVVFVGAVILVSYKSTCVSKAKLISSKINRFYTIAYFNI